ncbi:MAG TPA: ABC transporter ATP-binding protein [Burkholderiaceae bacterium]|nr:ABC transporter ATP-binding protein [Burkholderiaceae bacterium]
MNEPSLLRLERIEKTFASLRALDGVSLEFRAGEIHAVLGENGAGKSTLMKIIYGAVQPDAGTITWRGEAGPIASPNEARARGIAMVFQHFALFESVTAVENVALALPERVPLRELARRIEEAATRYGLPVHPWQEVHHLSVGERQRVEIVRCLLQSPRLLIMDEPTSVLTPQAVDQLFETLRRLAAEGTAIIYVSHKLEEIRRLCHRATIIRQGRVVGEVDPQKETEGRLAELMIGRTFPQMQRRAKTEGAIALELAALATPPAGPFGTPLAGISLRVHAGEVLGIAGISGNGQAELLAALSGETRVDAQSIWLCGEPIGALSPGARRSRGLTLVPEERLGVGAVPEMSLRKNALLTAYGQRLVRRGVIDRGAVAAYADRCISGFDVRCGGPEAPAGSLSGGNLQKFIVGREIEQRPRVMILAQPTWGVDVAATALIRQRLIDLSAQGVAILVISEDLGEILEVCDRVAVIAGGRMSPARDVHETGAEEIGRWMAGGFGAGDAAPATEAERVA